MRETWCMWWFLWPSPNLVRLAYASSEQGLRLGLSSHVKVQDCTATCVSWSGIHGPVMPTRTVQPLYWSSWTQANCWSRWTMATRRSLMRGHARWLVQATSKEYQALHFEIIKEPRHQRDTLEIDCSLQAVRFCSFMMESTLFMRRFWSCLTGKAFFFASYQEKEVHRQQKCRGSSCCIW